VTEPGEAADAEAAQKPPTGQLLPPDDAEQPTETPLPDETEPAVFPANDEIPVGADAGTTRTLMSLLSAHPFWNLYEATRSPEPLKGRALFCFVMDVIFRIVVVLLLLGIIAAVAYKTFAPLPHF